GVQFVLVSDDHLTRRTVPARLAEHQRVIFLDEDQQWELAQVCGAVALRTLADANVGVRVQDERVAWGQFADCLFAHNALLGWEAKSSRSCLLTAFRSSLLAHSTQIRRVTALVADEKRPRFVRRSASPTRGE